MARVATVAAVVGSGKLLREAWGGGLDEKRRNQKKMEQAFILRLNPRHPPCERKRIQKSVREREGERERAGGRGKE